MSSVDDDAELILEFLRESEENLDRLDHDLVALEAEPSSKEHLASVFRTIHTIKGTAGFFGFTKLQALGHSAENVLALLRDGVLLLDGELSSTLLEAFDAIRAILVLIARDKNDGAETYAGLIGRLEAIHAGGEHQESAQPSETAIVAPPPAASALPPSKDSPHEIADATVRVDVGTLDQLMTLVGELVLVRNQLLQHGAVRREQQLGAVVQRLNAITGELQDGVMKTRMQPVGTLWARLPRVVRDLSTATGKKVELKVEGEDTELDRAVLEAIRDPFTHLIRNAIDHGIEIPAVRQAAGKPEKGVIGLRAVHAGGQVILEISDDGAGIDPARIKDKAVEKGLLSASQAEALSDRAALDLIFLPGLSTAAEVTQISGRGVGMDVVKRNVEEVGGVIDLESQPGAGTTLRLKIPLTLTIIPTLIVRAGDRYAIPTASLLELVQVSGEEINTNIEWIHGVPVLRLRSRLVPLLDLRRELNLEWDPSWPSGCEVVTAVILSVGGARFGLIVDAVVDAEDIVVKPVGGPLRGNPVFSGATILGDGTVSLILDVVSLARRGGVLTDAGWNQTEVSAPPEDTGQSSLLLFTLGGARQMAIPLQQVSRIEEINASLVERVGQRDIARVQGTPLPLLRLSRFFGCEHDTARQDNLPVIIYTEEGRTIGLVVDRVQDIVSQQIPENVEPQPVGIRTTAIIHQHVTEIIDVAGILECESPRGRSMA